MMNDPFLSNYNRMIGDNMRFVRNFNANPQQYITPKPAPDPYQGMVTPMMVMLMYQMMLQMNPSAVSPNALPGFYPPPGMQPGGETPFGQNRAYAFLGQLFRQKSQQEPGGQNFLLTGDELNQVKTALEQGAFTEGELGQALKYELVNTSEAHLPAVLQLLKHCLQNGQLQAGPFLQDRYLALLAPARQEKLLSLFSEMGLHLEDGKPNTRFIGFILENISVTEQPQTRAFLKKMLQALYEKQGEELDTPSGRALSHVLELSDASLDDQGKLVFP